MGTDIRSEESKYFRVDEWQGEGRREAERHVVLGFADNDDGRLKYKVPDAPLSDVYYVKPWDGRNCNARRLEYFYSPFEGCIRMEVMNKDKPRREQVWERPRIPYCWSAQYIDKMAREKFMVRKGKANKAEPDMEWFRNEDDLSLEQYEYAVREWHRRIYGVWIYINGRLTHLTGANYFYLTHFKLDNGYPKYRDRDRRWYYAWQVCLEDKNCVGLIYLKHRRDGATYRCMCIGYETATRGHADQANFGITSKSDEDAEFAFQSKVVEPWKQMVPFFQPLSGAATDVKKKLEFKPAARSGADRFSGDNIGIGSTISYRAKSTKGKSGYDNLKLHIAVCDEGGKRDKEDILEAHRLMLPTMNLDGIWAKMLYPSTNEEINGDNADKWEQMWADSDPSIALKSSMGTTTSLLYRYFTPAYDGPDEQWFGPFGESIVHKPTEEQIEYLSELKDGDYKEKFGKFWDRGWGAYEWLMDFRALQRDPTGAMRQYPFTPEESFRPSTERGRFQPDKLNGLLMALAAPAAGKSINLYQHLTVTGRLEFVGRKFLSDVVFIEDPKGPFVFNKSLMPGAERAKKLGINANNVVRDRHGVANGSGQNVIIACDPTKMDAEDATGHKGQLSHYAAHGFIPYNYAVEIGEWDESDPSFAANYISHACIFEYYNQQMNVKPMNEDMLKATIFLNAKFHSEKQVSGAIQLFKDSNAQRLLYYNEILNGVNRKSGKVVAGQAATVITENQANNRISEYLDFHAYPDRLPFPRTITQLLKYDGTNANKLDLKVSFGFLLMAVQPRELTNAERRQIAQGKTQSKFKDLTAYTQSMCRLY